ncbi:MAG TPA: IclR family transcriptional regulator C-terminal domain-containing protein, partial [Thermoleophilia bacterium]|nr:IclR family transcriptional regulator C-terminal domain-containing protein [Thermoleophilia bacterium]
YLEELAVSTGTCAFVAVIRGAEVFVVASREAPEGIGVSIRVGYRFPLTFGSIGKAIGAFLPPDELEDFLARQTLHFHGQPSEATPVDLDEVRADLAEARAKGYGVDLGRVQAGVHAVSAPLLASREPHRPQGVVTLIGTFPAEEAEAHGERVAAKAREISALFGPLLGG